MATGSGENGRAPDFPRAWTASELISTDFPEPRWAIPGILTEGLFILGGRPKQGKSWMCLGWGIAISRGGKALGQIAVDAGEVLYLALEDPPRRLKRRLVKLGLDTTVKDDRFTLFTEWPRMGKGGLKMLAAYLNEHPGVRLVVVDTLEKIRRRTDGSRNANAYEEDYRTGEALKKVADAYGVCLVVVHHLRKMGADDPLEQISGTFGLTGAADGALVLGRERGKHDAVLFVTGRDVEERELALKWDPQLATWSLMGDAEEYRLSNERQAIRKVLRDSEQALGPKDVAGILKRSTGPVKQLMWLMAQDGQVKGVGDGRYMAIAEDSPLPFTSFTGAKSAPPAGTFGPKTVNGPTFTSFTPFTGSGRAVNEVKAVNEVNEVNEVKGSGRVKGRARDEVTECLDCGAALPSGWYFRCPDCLDRAEAKLATGEGE